MGSAQKGPWLFLFPFVHSTTCLEFPGYFSYLIKKVVFCPSQINQPRAWFSSAQQAQSFMMLKKALEIVLEGKEVINGIL